MSNQKVREIEALLTKLYEQASHRNGDAEVAKDVVVDLSEIFSSSISSEDIDLCISLLFNKEGLTEFCKLVAKDPKFVDAKKSCLDLFKFLLEKDASAFSKYANELEKVCRHLYNADASSKVRCNALEVFCILLRKSAHNLEFENFDFKRFIEQLCLDIRSNKGSLIVYHQLCTLGTLAKACPERTSGQANLIFKVLKEQLVRKTGRQPDCTAAAGAIRGITSYLYEFPLGLSDDPTFYAQIYPNIHNILDPNLNLPKRDIQRAALSLIHEQGAKFAENLLQNHETLFRWLSQWSQSSNRDDRKAGLRAIDTFIVVIANKLELLAEDDPNRCQQVFRFLLKEFNELLEKSESSSQISLAVKGYGLLAGPCRVVLNPDGVFKMFSRVLAVSQQGFFQSSEMLETKVASLPSYIEALGIIVSKLERLSSGMLDSLHQLSMALVENFQYVSQFKAFLAYQALFTLLCSLKEKSNVYRSFLHGFVYHFILHTCSHLPVVDKEFAEGNASIVDNSASPDTDSKWSSATGLKGELKSYKDYLPLWRTFLSPEIAAGVKISGRPASTLTGLSHEMYEEFLDCVLEMSEKLDLTTFKPENSSQDHSSGNEEASSDPIKGLKAQTPKDFQVYMNLCCLMEEVVPLQKEISLEAHLPRVLLYFVKRSSLEPLVSTHYSVLTVFLLSASHTGYFDREPTTVPASSEVETTKHLLTGYVSEVLQRCKQYRDHLLAACLTLLLQLPICIVQKILPELVSPLQMSLQMGLSYLPITHICVSALHLWSDRLEKERLHQFLPDVLPMLLPYLRSEESLSEAELQTRLISVKMTLATQRRRVDERKIKEAKNIENSEMRKVQLSILQLLGRLDQELCFSVVTNQQDTISNQAIAWDEHKHILFSVPFHEWKLDIFLDELLPDTIDKALNSSNRQTKVAACELLHSIVILMVGIGNQQSEQTQKKRPMTSLYQRVFGAMLSLSCDADHVTRQLFLTLIFQTIHWFTNNRTFEHPYTAVLLQAIMDGVVTPNDPSLRDLSAQCLLEFLKWSRKQSKDRNQSQVNLKSVLKRIISLCQHPSAYKRLGGCLAWNSIYTEVREDEPSCDEWMIFLLTNLIACLGYCQEDDPLIGTQSQCQAAIDHVERILRVRSEIFNKAASRRLPNDMEVGTLKELLEWLLPKIGSPSALVRHSSMNLIMSLGPHTKGFSSGQDFILERVRKEDASFLLRIIENSLPDSSLEDGEDQFKERSYKDVSVRIKNLLAALDAYVWVISKDIIKLEETFSSSDAKIFSEIDYFFLYYASRTSQTLLTCRESESPHSLPSLSLSQTEKLDELRCTTIVRVLDFVSVLANSHAARLLQERNVLDERLRRVLLQCIFDPREVGFNMKDTAVTDHLPQHLTDFLILTKRKIPPDTIALFRKEIDDRVTDAATGFLDQLPDSLDAKTSIPSDLHFCLDGLNILQNSGWLEHVPLVSRLVDGALDWVERVLFVSKDGELSAKEFNSKHHPFIKKYLSLAVLLKPETRDRLLSLMTSDTSSRNLDGRELIKGAHFLTALGDIPLTLVIEDPSLCLNHAISMATNGNLLEGMEFLSRLMKLMVKNADLRKRYSAKLIGSFLDQWETFCTPVESSDFVKEARLSLVMTAFMADKDDVIKTRLKSGDPSGMTVSSFFTSFLSDPEVELPVKSRALKLLPFFLTERDGESVVKQTLQSFRLRNLPLKFTEYQPGSIRERELKGVILEFLSSLELTASLPLLEFILRLFCCEEAHQYDEDLQKTLQRLIRASQTTKQMEILNFLLRFFRDTTSQSLRLGTLEKALIPSLHHASDTSTLHFFVGCVRDLIPPLSASVVGRSDEQQKTLVNKYGAYLLIQILYSKLPKEKVFAPGSEVNCAFDAQDTSGKELTKEILKRSVRTAKGELRHDLTHQELRRKCSCAAYNTLIAVLSNVQDQLKFYNNFLFSEVRAKDEAIFEGFIDLTKKFQFDVEVNFDPSKRNRFVAVHRKHDPLGGEAPREQGDTVKYMGSHYLSDSSLRDDLSQFDFSSSVVLSEAAISSGRSGNGSGGGRSGGMTLVKLDRGDFNSHEVMPNLTAIIRHMVDNNIMTIFSEASPPSMSDLPQWMSFVHSKLSESSAHVNVRLFLLRLVMNTEEVFAPYANLFVEPILTSLVDGVIGKDINYFVADLLVTLLSWGQRGIPQDKNLAAKTFQFLVSCTPHLRADVFKYNLNLIKSLVENWKSVLTVPEKALTSLLEVKNGSKREVEAGLQIAGILLANGVAPFDEDNPGAKTSFVSLITSLVTDKASSVYSAAAEVLGLFLKFRETKGDEDEQLIVNITQSLQSLLGYQMGQALSCVYFIQRHFPKIVEKLINKLLTTLPRLYGIHKERILHCLVSYAPQMEDVFSHLKEQNILENLTRKEAKTQLVSLQLVNAVLPRLKPKQIEYFLPGISCFEFHSAPSCRELMYEAFIWIYDNFDNEEGSTEAELKKQAQVMLLKGTRDEDAALRQSVRNFWIQRAKDLTVAERLLFTLTKLYTSETEDSFLLMATHVLLEATHSSADFLRPIFQHPLTECIFREMKISPGWKAQHASMVPLFVESHTLDQGSSLDSLISMTQSGSLAEEEEGTSDHPGQRGVQATQNNLFSATQNPGGASFGDTYNWVTGASLDASVADREFIASHAPTTSSVSGLYFSDNNDMKRFKRTNLGSSRLQPDEPDSGRRGTGAKASIEAQLLRRRFVANQDKEKQTTHFARQEEIRRKLRNQIEKERKLKREAQVTIYRQYRVGELPDVQIPHKALIAPLQALAEKDDLLASRLFQVLAEGVFRDSYTILSAPEQKKWKRGACDAIARILAASESCNPHVMRPLLHLVIIENIEVSLEHISSVCLRSNLEPLGILCLERQHLRQQRVTSEPARKKQRREYAQDSRNTKDTSLWLNIADLYKNLSMWDAVLGVLKNEIGDLKEETVKALEAESEKKHFEAYKNYVIALNKEDWEVAPSRQEQQVWEEWFVVSSENLGQWEEVERFVEERFLRQDSSQLQRLNLVWDLPRQSFSLALPALVRSKLMKILHGSDDDGGLCEFVEATRNNTRHRLLLESELGLPMAVLAVNQEKNEKARSLLRSTQVSLLSKLVQCSLLSSKSMVDHLKSVQPLSELQDFLRLIMCPSRDTATESEANKVVARWGSRETPSVHYTADSQFTSSYRILYLHFLKRSFSIDDKLIDQTKVASHVAVIKSALASSNPHLAHRHLTKLERIPKDGETECQLNFFKTEMSIMRAKWKEPQERLSYLVEAWSKYLGKVDLFIKSHSSSKRQIESQYLLLEASLCFRVCETIQEMGQEWSADTKHMKTLRNKFPSIQAQQKYSWYKELLQCSQYGFVKATGLLAANENTRENETSLSVFKDPYTVIFTFYEDCLEAWGDHTDVHQLSQNFLKAVLQGMAAGSKEAHFRFPRLLHLLEVEPSSSLISVFKKESERVPVWMFLLWLSHIFIYFDKAPGPALHPILKQLTERYPQAVIYPFEMSKESFNFASSVGEAAKKPFQEMKAVFDELGLVRQFITALSLVHVPHIELKDLLSAARRLQSKDALIKAIEETYRTLLVPSRQPKHACNERGSVYFNLDAMMKQIKSKYEKCCGPSISQLNSQSFATLKELSRVVLEDLEQVSKITKTLPRGLHNYSPWLAAFNASEHTHELEIPGQYHGLKEPMPEYHTKISSFGPTLLLMRSLRVPMRMTIIGSDEKEHKFLVKSGEDLRTDQRAQGIFCLLNNIYAAHGSSSHLSKKPSLMTYTITPLTRRVGILEWVSNTDELKNVLFSALEERELRSYDAAYKDYEKNNMWQFKYGMKKKDECVTKFKSIVDAIPWDLLRRKLFQLAAGHEGFFHLRNTFISSYATMCISHWLLGIGDRHLSNTLISLNTGNVVGIDFGHHFESATLFLPIPELMPFRLTRQIVNVMQPLGLHGQFRETMIACLVALRDQRQVIVAAVEAFVKEPSEDWVAFVSRLSEKSDSAAKLKRFSAQRMEDFVNKLRGHNPAKILASIVMQNTFVIGAKKVSEFRDVVLGKGHSHREKMVGASGDGLLSVAEQVDVLIEQATDPNILGRTFIGWQPFL